MALNRTDAFILPLPRQVFCYVFYKKIDLLLTKEISRFARNTLDSIFYTRKLKALGVGVLFMNDNINTLDNDAELRLTIMSSIAQEESRKTSERVKWGQKRSMEQGIVFDSRVLGYHLKNGKLAINEDEAKIVQLIYDLYLSGKGIQLLCKELENRAITAPNGGTRWYTTSVLSILKNEKYCGTLKQRKHITTDYLSHKIKTNHGQEKFITIENNHTPIISKETFDKTQEELARRRNATLEKSRYSNRYPFSGKIECAHCKSKFERRHNSSQKTDKRQTVWRCAEAAKYGKEKINPQGQKVGCNNKAIHERFLKENFAVLNSVIENKDSIIQELKTHVHQAIANSPDKAREIKQIGANIEKMATRKSKLIDLLVDGTITKAEYEKTNNQYDKQVAVLQKQWAALNLDNKTSETLQQKLDSIETAVENLARLKEFGDSVCDEVLHKIVVDGRDKVSYYLKTDKNATMFVKMPFSHTQYQHL